MPTSTTSALQSSALKIKSRHLLEGTRSSAGIPAALGSDDLGKGTLSREQLLWQSSDQVAREGPAPS